MVFFLLQSLHDIQFIGFNKIAPVAIFLTASGIKIMILNLCPGIGDLAGDDGFIFRRDIYFLFAIFFFLIGLNKIKFRTDYLPAALAVSTSNL